MNEAPFVVFLLRGEWLALSALAVGRILPRPRLLRLPALRESAELVARYAVHIGDEIVPLLSPGMPEIVLVLDAGDGRIALGVDQVIGVGPLGAGDRWAGQPVRRVVVAEYERALGKRPRPQPFLGRNLAAPVAAASARGRPKRVLQLRCGGRDWSMDAAAVAAVHAPVPVMTVPFAAPELLGVAFLRGRAVPVISPAPLGGHPACLVAVRYDAGAFAIPADLPPALTAASEAPPLDFAAMRAAAGLAPMSPEEPAAPLSRPASVLTVLPVTVSGQRYGLLASCVQRVLMAGPVARLPSRDMPRSLLDGATAVDGRLLPLTDARRWLGLAAEGAAAIHILLRVGEDLHVLAVDRIGRPRRVDGACLEPLRDSGKRLSGFVRLPGEVLPVLDAGQLGGQG